MRFVDTNVFIYVITAHPAFGPAARRILEKIEAGEEALTSTLVLCEVAWVLEAMGRQGDISSTIEKILSYESLRVTDFGAEDLVMGSVNLTNYRIDFNDGVNIAVMERNGVKEVYSNDERHLGRVDSLRLVFE
jgi:predicted nucleic acid-binding protein